MDKEELFVPKEKHFGKIIIILLSIGIILGGSYYYYKAIYSNPLKIANIAFEIINNIITNEGQNINTNNPLELNGLITIKLADSSKKDFSEIINNSNFQLNIKLNEKQKTYIIDFTSKYNNEKLIDINSYIENETIYYKSKDIYNEYVGVKGNSILKTCGEMRDSLEKIEKALSGIESWQSENKDKFENKIKKDLQNMYELVNVIELYGKIARQTAGGIINVERNISSGIDE